MSSNDKDIKFLASAKPGVCVFCGSNENSEDKFGKRFQKNGITVHYFCMLFASGLCQSGEDNEGIMGFLLKDIAREYRRARRLRCAYCSQVGGTIGCVLSKCRRTFHFDCGLKHGALNQFFGNFSSFCEEHRPRQTQQTTGRLAFHGTANSTCLICMNAVEARASNNTLRIPCCKNAWFHRACLQRHATSSGLHFFKCPLCNNKDIFQDEMLKFGIYIPDQDAAWEREPNAYQDLMERHSHCDVPKCLCAKGREYNKDHSKWEIVLCDWCGSAGVHLACGNLKTPGDDWVCHDCKQMASSKGTKKKKVPTATLR